MSPSNKKRSREAQPKATRSHTKGTVPGGVSSSANNPKRSSEPVPYGHLISFLLGERVEQTMVIIDPQTGSIQDVQTGQVLPLSPTSPLPHQKSPPGPPPIPKEPVPPRPIPKEVPPLQQPARQQEGSLEPESEASTPKQAERERTPPPVTKEKPVSLEELLKDKTLLDDPNHPPYKPYPSYDESKMRVLASSNELRGGWKIIGASRIGVGHMLNSKYREDDFEVRLYGKDAALIAIADGVGSKNYSRYGARAAVLGTMRLIESVDYKHLLHQLIIKVRRGGRDNELSCQQDAKLLLLQALHMAREKVRERAQKDNLLINDLQSTLLLFLVVPYGKSYQHLFLASVQIGDGALYALNRESEEIPGEQETETPTWSCLQQPQIQQSGNEVWPFLSTDEAFWEAHTTCTLLENAVFLMGMTDGVADDLEPPSVEGGDPFIFIKEFYHEYIRKEVLSQKRPAKALMDFLGYRKAQSFDDRTVVCIYRQE